MKNPFSENNSTPFAGTFLIVFALYNWEIIFSLFSFDPFDFRADKIEIINALLKEHAWYARVGWPTLIAFGIILFYYICNNISLGITTWFNRWFKPFILSITDIGETVAKDEYERIRTQSDMFRTQYNDLRDKSAESQIKYEKLIQDKGEELNKTIFESQSMLEQTQNQNKELNNTVAASKSKLAEYEELIKTQNNILENKTTLLNQLNEELNDFKILLARYGTSDIFMDVTQRVTELFEKNNIFTANNKEMGKDPIDGKVKELLIFYQTLHEIKTLIVNEDENVELAGKIIVAHATEDSKRKQIIKHKDQPSALTLGSLLSGNSTISGKGFIIPFPPPQIK